MAKKSSTMASLFRRIYCNEFQWDMLKSFTFFLAGVRLAKWFAGVEIMPAIPIHPA